MYLTGGATAVLEGWRESTVDVDVRFEPDADAALGRIGEIKERLDVNVELASPLDFLPPLPGWRERSRFRFREGNLEVFDFDPYSQALSKLERGFELDRRACEPQSKRSANLSLRGASRRSADHEACQPRDRRSAASLPRGPARR
jgi:hypothetical protein